MKTRDKLYVGGSIILGLFFGRCSDLPMPKYEVPKTVISDNYRDTKSHKLLSEIKEDINKINYEYETIDDKTKNSNWHNAVDYCLDAIDKTTSLAVRSAIEHHIYSLEYPNANEKTRDYLDTRLRSLFYNQNTAIEHILDSVKIDPMLQTVIKNDSISIGDYIESKNQFLEYRIIFLDGGEHRVTDNAKRFIEPRKIRFEIYDWNKKALGIYNETGASPELKFSKDIELDFFNNNYTFRDVMKIALEK